MKLSWQPGNVFTVLFGLAFIGVGAYIYAHMGRYLETSRAAAGVVVSVTHESAAVKKGRMHPVVRFTTIYGNEVLGTTQQHHNVQPGQSVQVLYDPARPMNVEIGTFAQVRRQRTFFTSLCVLVGIAAIAVGVVLDLGLMRARRLIRRSGAKPTRP